MLTDVLRVRMHHSLMAHEVQELCVLFARKPDTMRLLHSLLELPPFLVAR